MIKKLLLSLIALASVANAQQWIDPNAFVRRDGSKALTANWDAGSFQIRAETFYSDVTTGTAPFTVNSTTVVTNLNADLLDGFHASGFASATDYISKAGGTTTTASIPFALGLSVPDNVYSYIGTNPGAASGSTSQVGLRMVDTIGGPPFFARTRRLDYVGSDDATIGASLKFVAGGTTAGTRNGGGFTFTAGASSGGTGGGLTFSAGNSTSGGGGGISLGSGSGGGANDGGSIGFVAGAALGTGDGGDAVFNAGANNGTAGNGGNFNLFGGNIASNGPGDGGQVTIAAGSANTSAGTSGNGGNVRIYAGNTNNSGTAGIVYFFGGTHTGSGNYGYVRIGSTGTPDKLNLLNSRAVSSLYIGGDLEVDGIIYADGPSGGGYLSTAGSSGFDTVSGMYKFNAGTKTTGVGVDASYKGGDASSGNSAGGILSHYGGAKFGSANYGYVRVGSSGTPDKFSLSAAAAQDSLYVKEALEVDGALYADGALTVVGTTTLGTLTGILKGTSGVVAVASSSDLLTAIGTIDISSNTNLAVSSPITLTGDTVGFDFSTNNTWTGTNHFSLGISIPSGEKIYFEGAASDTYITYDSGTGYLQIYVNGNLAGEFK